MPFKISLVILCLFLNPTFIYSQQFPFCDPAALELEKGQALAGSAAIKGNDALAKLSTILKQIQYIDAARNADVSVKQVLKGCRDKKFFNFKNIANNSEASVKATGEFQEYRGDYEFLQNRLNSALEAYDQSLIYDNKNLDVLYKSINLFLKINDIKVERLVAEGSISTETPELLKILIKRYAALIEHPRAVKAVKRDAHLYMAGAERALNNFSEEMDHLEKVLKLDPQNSYAARRRYSFFLEKKLPLETINAFQKLYRENNLVEKDWLVFIAFLNQSKKNDDIITWSKRIPPEVLKKNTDISVYLARAYMDSSRSTEAQSIMKDINPNTLQSSKAIYEENLSLITEINADQLQKDGRLSEALDEYKKALKTSPRKLTVREKISYLIYNYRKGLDFKPQEATTQDLKEVAQLLEDSAFQTELKSTLFEVFLHSLRFIKDNEKLSKACLRFRSLYPTLTAPYKEHCSN